jgi:hypothetical protein
MLRILVFDSTLNQVKRNQNFALCWDQMEVLSQTRRAAEHEQENRNYHTHKKARISIGNKFHMDMNLDRFGTL